MAETQVLGPQFQLTSRCLGRIEKQCRVTARNMASGVRLLGFEFHFCHLHCVSLGKLTSPSVPSLSIPIR